MKRAKTKHHIIPRSRGGSSDLENLAFIPGKLHEEYHALFFNRTPEEIVQYLNRDFWNGHYKITIERYR